jgi:hypothetical protein
LDCFGIHPSKPIMKNLNDAVPLGDDLLSGVPAIAAYLKQPERRVLYLIEAGRLPINKRPGLELHPGKKGRKGRPAITARKSVLDRYFAPEEVTA